MYPSRRCEGVTCQVRLQVTPLSVYLMDDSYYPVTWRKVEVVFPITMQVHNHWKMYLATFDSC